MNWIEQLIESAFQGAIAGSGGCWAYHKDNCSYACIGPLTFKRGDGHIIVLTEQELRTEMSPT